VIDSASQRTPQDRPGLGQVAAVELVVAGDQQDRLRPVAEQVERRPGAVDVTGQHEQLAPGAGSGA
jgi:hypothetical protein